MHCQYCPSWAAAVVPVTARRTARADSASLRAFDPVLDTFTLTREELGRRANPPKPCASLLLAKPLMEVATKAVGGFARVIGATTCCVLDRRRLSRGERPAGA